MLKNSCDEFSVTNSSVKNSVMANSPVRDRREINGLSKEDRKD